MLAMMLARFSVGECNRKSCDIYCILAREFHVHIYVLCDVCVLSPRALFTPSTQHKCTIVMA